LLIDIGLQEIEFKYGAAGEYPQSYHNATHAHDVMDAATAIAELAVKAEKIPPEDKPLVALAACYHDIVHELGGGADEQASADILAQRMQAAGVFSKQDIAKTQAMILATVVHFENGVLRQSASPGNILTQILADADLSSLGREPTTYWDRAHSLLEERLYPAVPTREQERVFLEEQVPFLENHQFLTAEAALLFPYHQANVDLAKSLLAGFEKTKE
jgi:predicted metal-dependent HD superfamily phosphohydrolase